jgi:sugar phosphate isomerase/epimerase
MSSLPNRRDCLFGLAAGAGALAAGSVAGRSAQAAEQATNQEAPRVRYCLNTSTIRHEGLKLVDRIEIAAKAGYDAVEPWIREIDEYVQGGGELSDLDKRLKDLGLSVESAIGFAAWIVDDEAERTAGLETAKRDMDLLAQIGGKRIAAPPVNATKERMTNLDAIAERYRALLAVGDETGVTPQIEVWGFSATLSKLSECLYVAVAANHPKACVLADVYHLYKGGNDFDGLRFVSGAAMHNFHMNDYPGIARETIADADRVYCGEGVAPVPQILATLFANGYSGSLSLELFNPNYWKQDPLAVATRGLESMRASVEAARKLKA